MIFELAQVNIARLKAPLTDPQLKDFLDALAPVNALADAAPGFVWRLQTEDGERDRGARVRMGCPGQRRGHREHAGVEVGRGAGRVDLCRCTPRSAASP